LALAATALFALVFAAAAQAVSFQRSFTSLSTPGWQPLAIAVDQSDGDVYASTMAATNLSPIVGAQGSFKLFDSSGSELSCTLSPAPDRPASIAVDQSTGDFYLFNATGSGLATEVRAYPQGCGGELPATTGTADTHGTTELTNVSTGSKPLLVRQAVEGNGIPTATGTAGTTSGSNKITLESSSGRFAVGQIIIGAAFGATPTSDTTIVACLPSCAAPTELELSGNASLTATGADIAARTIVAKIEGSTVELSDAADASETGVAISGYAWQIAYAPSFPFGQPAVDPEGNLFYPNRKASPTKLQKYTPWGEELAEGNFPFTTKAPAAVSLDLKGDVFVTTSGESATNPTCANPSPMMLKKLGPEGEELAEGEAGVTGPKSEFAGLTSGALTAAVDQSTGNVYVGRNCHATFEMEVYGPGGGKLAEAIGSGEFSSGGALTVGNTIAIDEATGNVYATDPGNQQVQVYEDSSAQKTLSTTVSGGSGEVLCNETEAACLPEYDEGQEVIAEAAPGAGLALKEWVGTGSAVSCTGTTGPCTFTLSQDSSVEAVLQSSGPAMYALNLSASPPGSGAFECKELPSGSPEACAAEYEENKEVEVTENLSPGYHFVEWEDACSGAGPCVVKMTGEESVTVKNEPDSEAFTESVTGPGSLECEDATEGGGFTSCASTYPYGHTVKVTAVPNAGAHQVSLSGSGSAAGECSGSECSFEITEASGASAEFTLDEEALSIEEPGSGSGEVKCNGGSCAGPWHSGDNIELTATPTGGSSLGAISGTGSAEACVSSGCSFELTEASSVSVTFTPPGATELTVAMSGNGEGTVESTSPASPKIECGSTCSGIFSEGQTVTLKETAVEPGSMFLGWSANCTPTSATECEVEVRHGGTTVLAFFVPVPVVGEFSGSQGPCTEGGVKIEYAGETTYVCTGEEGQKGEEGAKGEKGDTGDEGPKGDTGDEGPKGDTGNTGPEGPKGDTGATGPAGATGATGANGSAGGAGAKGDTGPQGPAGATGPQGPQGPAAKVTVTCKVKYQGKKKAKVTCTVKYPKGSSQGRRLKWSLHRAGHVVSHGRTNAAQLQTALDHLRPGHYRLRVHGQREPVAIEVGS
jgi:hypothetical protein